MTAANQNVTGINVSTLPNGTITYSVTLTNPVGSTAASNTATLEISPSTTSAAVPTLTDSTNWSGYAVQTNSGTVVNSVSGSWIVPAVSGTGTAYSSAWVGIDGYNSSSVEQIGTDFDLSRGHPSYYAWYEMYPNAMVETSLTVRAGDSISASVVYTASNEFALTLTDNTTETSYSTTQTMTGRNVLRPNGLKRPPRPIPACCRWPTSTRSPSPTARRILARRRAPRAEPAGQSTILGRTRPFIRSTWSPRGATQDTTGSLTDSGAVSQFTVTYQTSSASPAQPTVPPWVHSWWRSPMQSSRSASSPAGNGSPAASDSGWLARDRVFASRDPWLW